VTARKDSDHTPNRIPKHIARSQTCVLVTEAPFSETATERSTETARRRQLRARLVSLLEPIFKEHAIEAGFSSKMKDEADLEIRRRAA